MKVLGIIQRQIYQKVLEDALAKLENVPELLLLTGHRNQSPGPQHLDYVCDLLGTVKAARDVALRGESQQMELRGSTIPFAAVSHKKMLGPFCSLEHIEG